MGNSESGRSRGAAHTTSALDSPRNQTKIHKLRSPSVDTSQVVLPRVTLIRGRYNSDSEDDYATCKPDVVASTRSKDIPAYYFTESQLRNAKKRSKSYEADLNRRLSVSDSQKTDVRQIFWSASNRESDCDAEDDSAYFTANSVDKPKKNKHASRADIEPEYVTARTELSYEPGHFQAARPAVNASAAGSLWQRVENFNRNDHGLKMDMNSSGSLVEGDIRIHMHLIRPITTRMPLTPMTLRDVVSSSGVEHGKSRTDTFSLPPGASKLIHITSKDNTIDVICKLLKKYNITDRPSRFALYEKDALSVELYMYLIEECRRLRDDDKPLLLSLAWSEELENGLDWRQFVLKDNEALENKLDGKQIALKGTHSADIDWNGFSVPELNNFLGFLNNEEQQQISRIRQNCCELKEHMIERMRHLSSVGNPYFGHYGDNILY